jgi:hypothetical protein
MGEKERRSLHQAVNAVMYMETQWLAACDWEEDKAGFAGDKNLD